MLALAFRLKTPVATVEDQHVPRWEHALSSKE